MRASFKCEPCEYFGNHFLRLFSHYAECSAEFSDDNQFLVIECPTAEGSRVEYSVNGLNIGEGMELYYSVSNCTSRYNLLEPI